MPTRRQEKVGLREASRGVLAVGLVTAGIVLAGTTIAAMMVWLVG